MTEVAHKTERLLASTGKPVQRTYVPRLSTGDDADGEGGDVVSRFEQNRQAREERSRRRCGDERQKRNEQFRREKELNRRKQELKQLLASDDEDEEVKPAQVKKTFVPKLSGTVKGKFAEMEKARAEDERKRAEEERRRRLEQDHLEKKKIQKELARKLAEEQGSGAGADADSTAAAAAAAAVNKTPGKLSVDFEGAKRAEEEEALRQKEEEKNRRYEENRRSFRESKRRSYLVMDEEEEAAELAARAAKTAAVPGKLQLSFEELERQRREEERRRTEEEARRRLDEERRAYLEARKMEGDGGGDGSVVMGDDGDDADSVSSEKSAEHRPGKLRRSFEEVERQRQQEERRRLEEARERLEEEKRAVLEARRSLALQGEEEGEADGAEAAAAAAGGDDAATPGKLKLSFEELERRRHEDETRRAEEEARRRLDDEKRSFVEARRSMVLDDDEDLRELQRGASGSNDSLAPRRLEINFEELLRLKQEEEARRQEEERRAKLEQEKRAMEEEKQHMEPDEVNESSETVSKEYEEIKTLKRSGTIKAKSLKSKFERMEQLSGEEIRRKIAEERARRHALEQERHDLEAQDFELEEEVSHPVRTVEAPCARRADMKARFAEMALAREEEARRRVDEQKMQRMRFEQQEIDAASLPPKEGEEEDGTPNGLGLNGAVAVDDDDELTRSGAPWFKRPLKNTQVVDGEPVRFLVRIVGSPRPDVTWWFEGEPLEDGEEYQYVVRGDDTYCLYLPETFPDDEGEYMCKAVSPKGSAATTCILTIESKAGAPEAVGRGRRAASDGACDDNDDDDDDNNGEPDVVGDAPDVYVAAERRADGASGAGGHGGDGYRGDDDGAGGEDAREEGGDDQDDDDDDGGEDVGGQGDGGEGDGDAVEAAEGGGGDAARNGGDGWVGASYGKRCREHF